MRAALIPLLMAMAACGSERPEGTVLDVTVVGEAGRDSGLASRMAAELTAATLIERDASGQLVGGLASSWRFVDEGKVLILRLRPVKWTDDKPLVASEVVTSFRRAAHGPDAQPGFRFAGIVSAAQAEKSRNASSLGVLAPTSRVVELRLDAPAPQLLDWLSEPGMSVRRAGAPTLSRYTRVATAKDAPASAPIVLLRRSNAASPDARPSEVRLSTTGSAMDALAAFRAGKANIVVGEGLSGLLDARTQTRREALRIDSLYGVYGYRVNTMRGPLANPVLRRKLADSIDRAAIARSFGLAAIQPEAGLLPATVRPSPGEPDLTDPAEIIEQSPTKLVLLVPSGLEHRQVAQRIAADWQALGIEILLREASATTRAKLIASGEFDLAVDETSLPVADGAALLDRFRCGMGPHCNNAADALLDAARLAPVDQRQGQLIVVEQLLRETTPFIALFGAVRWALVAPEIDNWVSNSSGVHPLGRVGIGASQQLR